MFSGIVAAVCSVTAVAKQQEHLRLAIRLPQGLHSGLSLGASVAINGVCLTVVALEEDVAAFDVIGETLRCTALGTLCVGDTVNAERALCYGMEIGGHLVEGHVMGCGVVADIKEEGRDYTLTIACPKSWMKYISAKGCIAVQGVSLTVGAVWPNEGCFCVHLIPETLRQTNLGRLRVEAPVHIEIDIQQRVIVDTVERLLQNRDPRRRNDSIEVGEIA